MADFLTPHFRVREFLVDLPEDEVPEDPRARIDMRLPEALEYLRAMVGRPIIITSGLRTWHLHELIYRRKYGDRWVHVIPFGSRHLVEPPPLEEISQVLCEDDRVLHLRWKNLPPEAKRRALSRRVCEAADIHLAPTPRVMWAISAAGLWSYVISSTAIHVDLRLMR